jgi:hypothetical protein
LKKYLRTSRSAKIAAMMMNALVIVFTGSAMNSHGRPVSQ